MASSDKRDDVGEGSSRATLRTDSPEDQEAARTEGEGEDARSGSAAGEGTARGESDVDRKSARGACPPTPPLSNPDDVELQTFDVPPPISPPVLHSTATSHSKRELVQNQACPEQRKNAILNLPPPLPFDMVVEGLTIGVPENKATSWIAGFGKKKQSDEQGKQKKKQILKDVSCECRSGEALAILGGSGSGKTTLLNAIANRLTGLPTESGEVAFYSASQAAAGRASGDRAVPELGEMSRGEKIGRGQVKKRIGFVRQQDFLVECLTVRETLTYTARLRLPTSLSSQTIALIVEQTIDELGLKDAADTVVGGPLRKGISGGEKRRLSIGCVLVTLPSVLILDEPTSGLDAFTSYLLLLTLSELARRGRTIILSIHAPRSDAFDIFDRIALLSKGEIVYSGLRSDCLGWFSALGHVVEKGVNPLDFLIDTCSVDNRTTEKEELTTARVHVLVQAWKTRSPTHWVDLAKDSERSSSNLSMDQITPGPLERVITREHRRREGGAGADGVGHDAGLGASDEQRPGMWKQTVVLTARAHRNVYRNVPQLVGFMVQAVLLGVIIGITYYRLPDTPTGVQSLKNLSFQLVPGVFYLQQVFWIYKFCTDLVIFDREREDRLYDVVPWVISDFTSFLIPSILSPSIYVVLVYFISKMRTEDLAANLFTIMASTMLVQFTTQGLALLSASILRSFSAASMLGNSLNLFQIMSSGFILTNVPVYVSWIRWISPYFYSFRIVATTQFKDRVFDCPSDSSANLNQCLGNNVLNGLKFNYSTNLGVWFAGLIGLGIVQYALACLVLWGLPAGGVKHGSEIESQQRGKGTDVEESHVTRESIDVAVKHLGMKWKRRGRGAMKDRSKTILDDVTMNFPAGEISAILGPSGAGKSTLLQLISGRSLNPGPLSHFTITGSILFSNLPASPLSQYNVAFVEQDDDWHLPSLTVRETLTYAAMLRLPDKMPRRQKVARAETVLKMLGLKDCADLPVGGALLKGISGGEKRRLSLAVQMINDPAVLVVDEPTSGLDASIALSVMQVLRDIAATGRTVIATIHQPRSDIWKLTDNVTLLAKGGVVAFTGKRSEALEFFTSIGYPMPSEFFNPADHLLDLVSIDPRMANHAESLARVNNLTAIWRQRTSSEEGEEVEKSQGRNDGKGQGIWGRAEVGLSSRAAGTTSMRVALPVVLERHWKNLWRRKDVFFNRLAQTPLLGGLFILFFQRLTHGPSGAQDRIGITIESTSAIAFVGLLNAMAIFPADRNLYLHEAKSSARYSPATFVITYTLVEIGFELLGGFGYAAIMNVGVGMQTSARIYFEFAIAIWAMVNMGESFAMILGSWIQTEGLTVTVVSTILSIVGQVSGVISLSVPSWLAGLAWATCVKAAVRVLIINESVGLQFQCTDSQISSGACVARSGEQLLALFGWRDLNTARYMGIMVAICVAWRVMAWVSIALRVGGFR